MELVKCSIIITSRFFQSYFEEVRTSRSLAERCGFQLPSRVCHQRDRTFPSPVGIVLTPSSFACHSKAHFITLIDATASLCQSPPPRQTGTLTMSQQTRTPSPTSASQVHNELQDHLTLLPEHACPSGLHYKRHVLSSLILWKELSVGPCPYIFPVPYSQNLEPSILYTHQFSLFPFFTIANTHHRPPQTLPLRAPRFEVRR